jgi:hypothetical protein
MEKITDTLTDFLSWIAIAVNILFVLWILYNGINEGFEGTLPEKISYISLMGLLTLNAVLLLRCKRKLK